MIPKIIPISEQNLNNLKTAGFILILYLVFYLLDGLYFGWIDDIFMINYLKGTFYGKPDNLLFIDTFIIWSSLLKNLYISHPAFPWYELLEYSILALAILKFNISIYNNSIPEPITKPWQKYFLLAIVNAALFFHLFQLSTFTSVCIFSSAVFLTSYFLSISEGVKKRAVIYLLLFCASFLMRPLLVVPITIISVTFFLFLNRARLWRFIPVGAIIIASVASIKMSNKTDTKLLCSVHDRAVYLLDGLNTPILKTNKMDSDVRYQAFFSWFCGDAQQLYSDSFLRKIEPSDKMAYHSQYFFEDLKAEYQNSSESYDKSYGDYRNWSMRAGLLLCILVLTVFLVLSQTSNRNKKRAAIISTVLFAVMILLISGSMKMEERFFYPTGIGVLFLLLSINLKGDKDNKKTISSKADLSKEGNNFSHKLTIFKTQPIIKISILIFLFSLALIQIIDAGKAHTELEKECELKREFIDEINLSMKGKVAFFDTWSMACVHLKPFRVWSLNPANQYSCYGETWSNFLPPHMKYLSEFCSNPEDMGAYFDCLSERKDVVFLITSYRAEFLEKYLSQVCHLNVRFRKISSGTSFEKLKYTFMPFQYEFGLYQIEKIE